MEFGQKTYYWLAIVGALLIAPPLLYLAYLAYLKPAGGAPAPQMLSDAQLRDMYDIALSGDYEKAQTIASQQADAFGTTTVAGQRAVSGAITADFWSGDMQKRINSVRATKEQLRDYPGTPYNQALLINRLLGYITTAMEPAVIDEIYSTEPYAAFRVQGDDTASLRKLAEYSLSKEYTNLANFKVGISYASDIFKHYDGVRLLSEAELEKRVSAIKNILAETASHYEEEERRIYGRPFWELQAPAYYYFQGFLYGTIALVHPEYMKDSTIAFSKVSEFYRNRLTEDGNPNAMIGGRLVYTDFSLATFSYAIYGDGALVEVRSRLQEMIDLMRQDPESHRGAFLSFLHQTMLDGPSQTPGRWYSYGRFKQMADLYPPFKDFLVENGWILE